MLFCRERAYTCWRTATGARVNNYGTRIDLMLAANGRGCEKQNICKFTESFSDIVSMHNFSAECKYMSNVS